MKELQQFHNNPTIIKFDETTIEKLKKGSLYTYGRDRKMKPIIILRFDRFDTHCSVEENYGCVYYLMLVIIGFMMVPHHA